MKGNVIQMNTLHLNSVRLNGIGKVQSVSLKGGSTEDPVFPPVEPPIEPEPTPTYTLSASVTNGMVSAKRNGSAVTLPFTANEGDVIVVEVTPNDGYTFEGWNDGNTDNPRTITMNADVALSAQCVEVVQPPVGNYIQFEDAEAERVLMSKGVSSDGVGITMEDAAAVTSISTWFKGNTAITSFEEFKYFKNCTTLEASAFEGCSNLASLPLGHIVILNNKALYGCTALSYDYLSLDSCTTMGANVLYGVKVKKLNLPILPTLPGASVNTQNYGDKSVLEEIAIGGASVIPESSFRRYSNLASAILNEDIVTTIGAYAFAETLVENSLRFPNLASIGAVAFGSSKVKRVENLGKITTLAGGGVNNGPFNNCSVLEYIRIPSSVTSIESYQFAKCYALSTIICEATTPPSLGGGFLNSVSWQTKTTIYVPDASLEAYRTATNWNTYADRIHPLSEIEGGHITTFEGLIGAYTFEGRSNEDADRDIVEDKSGYNNTLTLKSMQWGFVDSNFPDLVREGLWDDALWLSQSGYGEITLPNGLTDFTIIAKRFVFAATAGGNWSPLVGTGKSSGKGLFWLEYNAGDDIYTTQVNGLKYTLPSLESEVTWLTNTHYNGHRLIGTQGNDVHDGMVYINKFRGDVNGVRFQKIYAVYLFNRQLSPSEIEAFIKEKIDASYVLPTIEQ